MYLILLQITFLSLVLFYNNGLCGLDLLSCLLDSSVVFWYVHCDCRESYSKRSTYVYWKTRASFYRKKTAQVYRKEGPAVHRKKGSSFYRQATRQWSWRTGWWYFCVLSVILKRKVNVFFLGDMVALSAKVLIFQLNKIFRPLLIRTNWFINYLIIYIPWGQTFLFTQCKNIPESFTIELFLCDIKQVFVF